LDNLGFDFLTDEERIHFFAHAVKLAENHSPAYLRMRETPWSPDHDVLIYIDDIGVDSAYGDGVEVIINKFLDEDEKLRLNQNGYVAKEGHLLAYGRFLMERFVYAVVAQKAAAKARDDFAGFLADILKESEASHPVDEHPEESATEFVARIEAEIKEEMNQSIDPRLDSPTTDEGHPNNPTASFLAPLERVDNREAKGLWAPGHYSALACVECNQPFLGHKRATQCAPCAYGDNHESTT
jgi:hypothetical protein